MSISPAIGIVGFDTYFPPHIETAADLVEITGIPEAVLREKWAFANATSPTPRTPSLSWQAAPPKPRSRRQASRRSKSSW